VKRAARPSLRGFLEALTLSAEENADDEKESSKDVVTLMTLHSAKGLEFPRVYLVGLEEGLMPHRRALAEGEVEEERRLMYVGITRAQRALTLCQTKARARHGRAGASLTSRFVFELKGETPPPAWQRAVREAFGAKSLKPARRTRKAAAKPRAKRAP